MTEFDEEDLRFVASKYGREAFDTEKAIARFQRTTNVVTNRRRWWATAAAAAAFVTVVFAAGTGIVSYIKSRHQAEPQQKLEPSALNPDVATTHEFIYDDAPIGDVLAELSAYYHCELSTNAMGKHLTATFPDEDIEFIVSLIEEALGIDIMVKK